MTSPGELLIIPAYWPHGPLPEFLDPEVEVLTEVFSEIRVAPLRPSGDVIGHVPPGVEVDYSLAAWIGGGTATRAGRYARAARSLVRPEPEIGWGAATRSDLASGMRRASWVRSALMFRADLISVMLWARRTRRPAMAYTFWLGPATVGLRRAWPSTPVVSRAHGGDLYCEAHGWRSIPFQADAVASVDLLAAISQNGRMYLANKYPKNADSIALHRIGFADLGALADPPPTEPIRILSVSTIDQNKRVDKIASSAIWLARSGVPVHWTHLGDGPGRHRVLEVLEHRPESLTFNLRGLVSNDLVREELLHGRHAVFVNLSRSEGAPVSLMEAQCVGLPVVATGVGGSSEVADPEWNYLVGVDADEDTVANAIRSAVQTSRADAAARRLHWLRNFDAKTVYPQFAEKLVSLAASDDLDPDRGA